MLFQRWQTPKFLAFRASCRTGCKRTLPGSLKLSRFVSARLLHLGRHAGRIKQIPSKPKATDELKVALQNSCHKNTSTRQGGGKLHQVFDCLHGCGCQLWSRLASAVPLSISKFALSSHRQQTGSFQNHQQTTGEDKTTLGVLRNGSCLGWNSIILSFSDVF